MKNLAPRLPGSPAPRLPGSPAPRRRGSSRLDHVPVLRTLFVLTAFVLPVTTVHPASVCQSLVSQEVGLGEARYRVLGSSYTSNTVYSNAYYDGGDELSLTSSYPVGWAGGSDSYGVSFTSAIEDLTGSNCSSVYILLDVYNKAGGAGCASTGSRLAWAEHKVNTCSLGSGNADIFFGNRAMADQLTGSGQYWYRIYVLDYSASPVLRSEDTGCFNVGSSASACF